MPKRQRERGIEFKVSGDVVIIKYNARKYSWNPPKNICLETFLNEDQFEYSVVHDECGASMFNVEDLRKNVDILRQEVNPLKTI